MVSATQVQKILKLPLLAKGNRLAVSKIKVGSNERSKSCLKLFAFGHTYAIKFKGTSIKKGPSNYAAFSRRTTRPQTKWASR